MHHLPVPEPGPVPDPASGSEPVHEVSLRLLATTDLHAHIFPHDYCADRPAPGLGLGHVARLIARARSAAPNCLLFDNGDMLNGNPLGDFVARLGPPGGCHPVIAAMNTLGYDAAAAGNHEFNYGLPALLEAVSEARFPVLCANMALTLAADPAADDRPLPPFVVLERIVETSLGRRVVLRVGVIGLVTPQVTTWDAQSLGGILAARDMVAAARALVPRMRAAGADIVVALAHTGIGGGTAGTGGTGPATAVAAGGGTVGAEDAALALARLEGIDAVIAGHSHQTLPGPAFAGIDGVDAGAGTLAGKPAVMAGFWGSHLGVIDLVVVRAAGGWRVTRHRTALQAANPDEPPCPRVLAAAQAAHDGTLAHIRRPVGHTDVPLHSHFALVGECAALHLVADSQRAELAARIGDRWPGVPILSAVSPFKSGGRGGPAHYTEVPAGDLLLRHIADLYPFPNTLCGLLLTGAQVRRWLEHSAAVFSTVVPGQTDQHLLRADAACHNFDVIDGLSYRIDVSRPAQPPQPASGGRGAGGAAQGGRIVDLCWNGRPVAPAQRFLVAVNSYRAGGGGAPAGLAACPVVHRGQTPVADIIARHVALRGGRRRQGRPSWSFAPVPGAQVIVETGPGADSWGPPPGLRITRLGPGADGFLRWRLSL